MHVHAIDRSMRCDAIDRPRVHGRGRRGRPSSSHSLTSSPSTDVRRARAFATSVDVDGRRVAVRSRLTDRRRRYGITNDDSRDVHGDGRSDGRTIGRTIGRTDRPTDRARARVDPRASRDRPLIDTPHARSRWDTPIFGPRTLRITGKVRVNGASTPRDERANAREAREMARREARCRPRWRMMGTCWTEEWREANARGRDACDGRR